MSSHSLLQGILLTQGSKPGLLHCRQILYHLSHQGSPTICVICYFILFEGSLFLHLGISSPVWRQSECHVRRKQGQSVCVCASLALSPGWGNTSACLQRDSRHYPPRGRKVGDRCSGEPTCLRLSKHQAKCVFQQFTPFLFLNLALYQFSQFSRSVVSDSL